MKIGVVRIRDAWANRRLVICARSFKALSKPAQQLVEHLRKCGALYVAKRSGTSDACVTCLVATPASLITFAHFAVSLAMKARNCSGLSPTVVRPCSASFSFTAGSASAVIVTCSARR